LKAVLDKPEMKAAKDAIFESARRAAELEPIAAIVPTVADAQFMQEHTAALVGLKTASMRAANDPALIPQVLDQLDQQFAIVDKDGKALLGPDGKPQFAADRAPFIDGIVNREMNVARTKVTGDVAALKAKLASGVYPNEAAKARDQATLDNLEYAEIALKVVEQIRSGEFFQDAAPQIPQDATPEFKAWAEAETKRIADERKALEDQRTGANKDANKATATQFATDVRMDFGASAAKVIGETFKAVRDSGVYIPEFYLQNKYMDRATGTEANVPEVVARVFMNLESELMKPGSRTLMEIVQHELLPPTPQTRALRAEWYQRQVAAKVPGLVRAEVQRIQDLVKADQAKLAGGAAARAHAAQQEPNTGTSNGLPQAASDEQITKMARENAKNKPNYAGMSPSGQEALFLTEYHKLRK
jgi:hypothetical protein